jgi:hypothetical protein
MSKSTRDDSLAQDDDFPDDGSEWSEPATDNLPRERGKSISRGGPKWKAIEEYWEEKRLQDALQDYMTEEE